MIGMADNLSDAFFGGVSSDSSRRFSMSFS